MKNLFYRSGTLDFRATANREVELSFSSEAPVSRWFGDEILLHGPDNVDLSRLQSVGSLIYGHNPHDLKNIVGAISKAWLAERRGKATVVFDDDESGNSAMVKVKSGSLKGVSVGYQINEAIELQDEDTWTDPGTGRTYDKPGMIATKWTPYEISLTPIPADPSVGIGRDLTRSLDGIQINTTNQRRIFDMKAFSKSIAEQIRDELKAQNELIGRARMISNEALAWTEQAIREGRSAQEIRTYLLDIVAPLGKGSNAQDAGAIRSFKDISDEDFYRALCDPAPHPLDAPGMQPPAGDHHAGIRSFKQITDDDFFEGLKNPSEFSV